MTKILTFITILFLPWLAYAAPDASVSSISGSFGSTVSVTVTADFSVAVNSIQYTFKFDPSLLTVSSVTKGSAISSWTFVSNPNTPGTVKVAMFNPGGSATSASGSQQQLTVINFCVGTITNGICVSNGSSETSSTLGLGNVLFDSATITTLTQGTFTLNTSAANYTLTVNESGNGSVTEMDSINGTTPNFTSNSFPSGTVVQLTPEPGTGYQFSDWTGNASGSANPLSLTMNATTNVTANFSAQTETVTASAGSNGSITPSGTLSIAYGANQTFTVAPSTGYTPHLTVDGTAVTLTNNAYTLPDITTSHAVLASFNLQTETITVSTGSGGTISPSGSVSVNYGASQIFTLTPSSGYTPKLTVDGTAVTLTANNTYTMSNITMPHTVAASFSSSTSPDGSTLSAPSSGSLITSAGTWTFSALMNGYGNLIDLNGSSTGGYAALLMVENGGKMYAQVKQGSWYLWSGSAWTASSSPVPVTVPAAPTGLTATAASSTLINLSWTASTGATSYTVYRNGTQVGISSSASYPDTGVSPSTTYSYTVSASNSAGSSAQSSAATATTPAGPTTSPNGSSITPASGGSLVTSAGTWTFSSLMNGNGSSILLNNQSTGGYAALLMVEGGQMYAQINSGSWYLWSGSSWVSSSSPVPVTIPPVPTGLTATAASSTQINLTWTASSGATGYKVFRNGTQVGTSTSASYSDMGLSPSTTYSYTVSATNSAGSSAQTSAVSASTPAGPSVSASGSTITYSSGGSLVTSAGTWTFSSSSRSGNYAILLNGSSAGGGYATMLLYYNNGMYAQINTGAWYLWSGSAWNAVSGDPRPSVSPNGSTITPSSGGSLVTSAGTWTFSSSLGTSGNVILLNGNPAANGEGVLLLVYNNGQMYAENNTNIWFQWSSSAWATISGDPRGSLPTVPTGLTGTAVSSSQINLSWNVSTSSVGMSGYKIYRNGAEIGVSSGVSYIDTVGLAASTSYSYTVSGCDINNNCSAQSTSISVETQAGTGGGNSPDGSTLSAPSSGSLVTSAGTWTFGTQTDAYGSLILLGGRSTGGYAAMMEVNNGGQMYVQVSSAEGSGWYLWNGSVWVSSSAPVAATIPPVPTGLTAAASSSTQINLTWNASSGATGYKVYRNGTQVGTSSSASYSDTGLSASTTYYYTVSATNSAGTSSQTSAVSATTQATPSYSPNGSTLSSSSTGSLVNSAGTWTFGTQTDAYGNLILINGRSTSGYAALLMVDNGYQMYAQVTSAEGSGWYLWNGSSWVVSSNPA